MILQINVLHLGINLTESPKQIYQIGIKLNFKCISRMLLNPEKDLSN